MVSGWSRLQFLIFFAFVELQLQNCLTRCNFFPCFLLFDFSTFPMPTFSCSTLTILPPTSCSALSLSLPWEVPICLRTSSFLRGNIPVPRNPLIKFSGFMSLKRRFKSSGKCCLGSILHLFSRLFQLFFIGRKAARFIAWQIWVKFGTSVISSMFCCCITR